MRAALRNFPKGLGRRRVGTPYSVIDGEVDRQGGETRKHDGSTVRKTPCRGNRATHDQMTLGNSRERQVRKHRSERARFAADSEGGPARAVDDYLLPSHMLEVAETWSGAPMKGFPLDWS